ncbi:MAG: glycine oxidase ThiO [Myxococcota bacterium]|nr:glycine oxidase ThiO [Myxococcota bacterium]
MTERSDVLVVGGGVIGCAVAWFAAREGLSVTLLERGEVAGEASGAAAGMLLPFGEAEDEGPFLHWALKSLGLFPELCAELRERSGIDPELEASGALHVATSEEAERDLRARARRFAARRLEWLDAAAARREEPRLGDALRGALSAPDEAHVRSPLLTRAYAGAAAEVGARIERGAAVTGLLRQGARVAGVETDAGARHAGSVVLCAGAWVPGLVPFHLPVEPVRGQIVSLENLHPPLRLILVSGGVYLVPKRDGSLVVGATEEPVGFDCRVTAGGVAQLLAAATGLVPALADARLRDGWAGLRPATPDRLPLIGRVPGHEGLIVAAGHFRNGVLLSPITGRLVADLLLGKALPEAAAAFRPDRF